jgi:hypothetical protein
MHTHTRMPHPQQHHQRQSVQLRMHLSTRKRNRPRTACKTSRLSPSSLSCKPHTAQVTKSLASVIGTMLTCLRRESPCRALRASGRYRSWQQHQCSSHTARIRFGSAPHSDGLPRTCSGDNATCEKFTGRSAPPDGVVITHTRIGIRGYDLG